MDGSHMKKLALPVMLSIGLLGCVSEDESVPPVPPVNSTFKAMFVPAGGIMPFPNDLFFSGTVDGTLNIPVADPNDVSDYLVAMNAQDGYSTTAPLFIPFNDTLDPATVSNADVIIFNSTTPGALVPGTDYSVSVSAAVDGGNNLQVTILRPLAPKSRFVVVVPRTVSNLAGDVAAPDDTFQAILDCHGEGATPNCTPPASLTTLMAALDPALDAASGLLGVPDANNLITFTFLTQSTTDVMAQVNAATVAAAAPNAVPGNGGSFLTLVGTNKSLLDPTSANPAILNVANVYAGFVAVPYYSSRTNLMTGRWLTATGADVTRYTALAGAPPAATETLNVPMLVSVPSVCGAKPGAGWPVVLFQHGITQNRTNLLPLAQPAAGACFAVVAIDHPLHGLPPGHPLRITVPTATITEPTFDADASNNTTRAPGADGIVDASGQNYINLSSLLTSRDNLRQTAANLIRVAKSIPTFDYDGDLAGDFDGSRIHFAGHSLGAITGTTFLGVNTDVQAATLAMPGGTIARLLRDSPTFSVSINAGLAANGVVAGTQLYEQFMQAAQTAVDAGDPINFAAAANANHSIHLIQVVGNGGANLPDQVVPNSATARLIAALGIAKRSANGANAGDGYVNFTAGDHSSILNPAASLAATVEMQTEFANFMGSNGAAIVINTGSGVIEP